MKNKTFKPGESAYGGLIEVTIDQGRILVAFKDWNTKAPLDGLSVQFSTEYSKADIDIFVSENATSYWADQVNEWIEKNISDPRKFRAHPNGW